MTSAVGTTGQASRPRQVARTALASLAALALAASATWLSGQALEPDPGPSTPFEIGEKLRYEVVWPSGLPVGTSTFSTRPAGAGWQFDMTLRASLPSFEIDDAFRSNATADLCSLRFEKHIRHGKRQASEMLRFAASSVERTNLAAGGAGRPSMSGTRACARDALAFLYFLRRELAAGRVPPPQDMFFGAAYRIRLDYAETRWLTWDGERQLADELRVHVRGPASQHSFSAYFSRDEARTPLLFRAEFEPGPFSMRLVEDWEE